MKRRDAKTVAALVDMLHQERGLRVQFGSLHLQKAAEVDRLQSELDDAQARIADVESVADAVFALNWGRYGPRACIADICGIPTEEAAAAFDAAAKRFNEERSKG